MTAFILIVILANFQEFIRAYQTDFRVHRDPLITNTTVNFCKTDDFITAIFKQYYCKWPRPTNRMERIFQFSAQQQQRSITIWTASTCCQASTSADHPPTREETLLPNVQWRSTKLLDLTVQLQLKHLMAAMQCVDIVHGFCAEVYGSRTPLSQWTTWTWTNGLQVSLSLYLRRDTSAWWLTTEEYPSCQSQVRFTTKSWSTESEIMTTPS